MCFCESEHVQYVALIVVASEPAAHGGTESSHREQAAWRPLKRERYMAFKAFRKDLKQQALESSAGEVQEKVIGGKLTGLLLFQRSHFVYHLPTTKAAALKMPLRCNLTLLCGVQWLFW